MKRIFCFITCSVVCFLYDSAVYGQAPQWAWSKSYGGVGNESGSKIAVDSRNGVYTYGSFNGTFSAGGTSLSSNGGTDLFLMKHDTLGGLLWSKGLGSIGEDSVGNIITDRQGDIIISGSFSNTITIGTHTFVSAGQKNIFAAKLDNAGNIIWAVHFPSPGNSVSTALKTDASDNIYIGGNYSNSIAFGSNNLPGTSASNMYFAKLRPDGTVIWARQNSSSITFVSLMNIECLNDNRIVLLGATSGTGFINFNDPNAGPVPSQFTSPSQFAVKLDTSGVFISQMFDRNMGSLLSFYNVILGYKNDIIAFGTRGNLTGTHPFHLNLRDSNFVIKSIQELSTAQSPYSSGRDVVYTKDKRTFFSGIAVGNVQFGSGLQMNSPGRESVFLYEKDTSFNGKSLLAALSSYGSYSAGAVDTFTNSLYFSGDLTGAGLPTIFGPDTLYSNGGSDIMLSKISINGYYFTLNDTSVCIGHSVGLGINSEPSFGQGPYTYSWSPATGLSDPNAPRTYANPAATTNYTLEIEDALGNSITRSVIVNVTAVPTAIPVITANGPLTFCQGQSVTLSSSPGMYYKWSNGFTTQTITVNTAGSYSVQVSDGSCYGPSSAPAVVQINALPATPVVSASGPFNICNGNSVTLTSSASTGNTWSNGATSQSIIVSTPGFYSVQYFNGQCLSASSSTVSVVVTNPPATPVITASGPLNFCLGNSVTLTSSATNFNTWSNGATTQSITVSSGGNYSVRTSNSACTSAFSAPVSVQVNPVPAAPVVTAGGPTTFCAGGNVVLTSSPGQNYIWSNGANTQSITVNTSGTYSVKISSAGCESPVSNNISVLVNPLPGQPTITAAGPLTFCAGGNVVLTSSPGQNYTWSNGATTQSITVNASGTYSVKISSAGCESPVSNNISVLVNPLPGQPTITAGGPMTFCEGGSVTLTSSPAQSYVWSNAATTQSITVNTSGTYTVKVSSAGCESILSAATSVAVNADPPIPVITQSGNLLSSSASSGNQWHLNTIAISGAVANTYSYTIPGVYSVQVTNAAGCTAVSEDLTASRPNGTASVLRNGEEFVHLISPNPVLFNGSVVYHLLSAVDINISLHNGTGGKLVTLLNNRTQGPGYYSIPLNSNISALSSGVYFIVYRINGENITDRFVIAR